MLRDMLKWMKGQSIQKQLTSVRLREKYISRYNINIGMYSYGCFDMTRIGKNTNIGRYCSFSNTAYVYTRNHGVDFISTTPYLYNTSLGFVKDEMIDNVNITFEDDVWVGHGAVVLPGARIIGRGSVIAAGAVVTKPVEPYTIVGGNPARFIRHRFSTSVIAQIEALRWWDWDLETLRRWVSENPTLAFYPATTWNRD